MVVLRVCNDGHGVRQSYVFGVKIIGKCSKKLLDLYRRVIIIRSLGSFKIIIITINISIKGYLLNLNDCLKIGKEKNHMTYE